MASLCSLQGLQPAKRQGQRLCSLQGLSKNKQEVIHDIWSDDDDDNNNSIDDINFYETYLAPLLKLLNRNPNPRCCVKRYA